MCGIAGIINYPTPIEPLTIKSILESMKHRGPDDVDVFMENSVALMHTRLSIIDLHGGRQPMFNENKNLVVVFNGEIYNFMALRNVLKSKGHLFLTGSDTETILHAYEEWGTECVKQFSGMFAFVIFDRQNRSLFLSRDRCGEKPLYYVIQDGILAFSSEIQSLFMIFQQQFKPDFNSIYYYLRLGYIPSPHSFYQGIKKLEPGSFLVFQDRKIKKHAFYYQPEILLKKNKSEIDFCDELDCLLLKAVKKMLVADVPLGAFLSGGVDSSLIVAMMSKLGKTPDTFSISFGHASFDETQYAEKVSKIIGTNHTNYVVDFNDFDFNLKLMDSFGEPFADYSAIPTWYLSRETRKNITVALTGDGGDELFGGYRRYLAQKYVQYYRYIPKIVREKLLGKLLSKLPDTDQYYADSIVKKARIFFDRVESSKTGLMFNTVFSHAECLVLFPEIDKNWDVIDPSNESNLIEALIKIDRQRYLPDDILVKVDRMSMRNSLETRAPFLDSAILKFSDSLPLPMKIKGHTQKYLLKKLAMRYLPKDIVFRKKHGFMPPMQQWLYKTGRMDIRRKMPIYANFKAVDALLDSFFDQHIDCSHKLFALIILGRYLR